MSHSCEEKAVVTGLAPDGRAIVEVRRAEACHSCVNKGACTTLGGQTKDLTLLVENKIGARAGDQVILTMDEASVIKASAVIYLLPALGLIAGALVGSKVFLSEMASVVGCAIGLCVGLLFTKLISTGMAKKSKYMPRLTAIIGSVSTNEDTDSIE